MSADLMKNVIKSLDERRNLAIPGDTATTLNFCAEYFFTMARESIQDHNYFAVALSGGSTPKAVYELIASSKARKEIDWKKVLLFWSDERNVLPDHPESNYLMAMEAGFSTLGIPSENIFRMHAEKNIEANAKVYEELIVNNIPKGVFDLVLLGVGDDGHTASLFPHTHGLHPQKRLVIANFIPDKDIWRMTLTFECINNAHHCCIFAIGRSKADILVRVLKGPYDPDNLPSQRVGTVTHQALWIADLAAASKLINNIIA